MANLFEVIKNFSHTFDPSFFGDNLVAVLFVIIIAIPILIGLLDRRRDPKYYDSMTKFDNVLQNFKGSVIRFICNPNDISAKKMAKSYQTALNIQESKNVHKKIMVLLEEKNFQEPYNGIFIESETPDELVAKIYKLTPKI